MTDQYCRLTAKRITKPLATLAAALCAGCGTFQLASAVYPPAGKNAEQQQLDNLACKDKAKLEANTAERQAGAFALGLTIVGAPVAYELEKAKQREVYAECMQARGYRVVPANDANAQTTAGSSPPQPPVKVQQTASPAAVSPSPASMSASTSSAIIVPKDATAQLEKLNELRAKGLITEDEYRKKRQEVLDRL